MIVSSVTINKVWLFRSFGFPVRIERLALSVEMILAVVILVGASSPLRTNNKKAFDCGGMLRVILGENMASTHIPS